MERMRRPRHAGVEWPPGTIAPTGPDPGRAAEALPGRRRIAEPRRHKRVAARGYHRRRCGSRILDAWERRHPMDTLRSVTRRGLLRTTAITAGTGLVLGPRAVFAQAATPAIVANRPEIPYGVQVGDIAGQRAILWSKADRAARMQVRWATTESMANAREAPWINALESSDFTAKIDIAGLPAGQRIFYEVSFLDLGDFKTTSAPVRGVFRTPPPEKRDIRFVWSGDTAGQGWGINPNFGGMKIYEQMRLVEPDFFLHSGDTIYADGPIEAEKAMPGGGIWKNVTTEAK